MHRRQFLTLLGAGLLGAACSSQLDVHPRAVPVGDDRQGLQTVDAGSAYVGGAADQASSTGGPPDADAIIARHRLQKPTAWGTDLPGIRRVLPASSGQRVALTFDACGGPRGSAVDQALLSLLEREQIPATLFLNSRWIEANVDLAHRLAANPLFELGNHGTRHAPLSVTGRSAYGIAGTRSVAEVVDEVWVNHERLRDLTGAPPRWFRTGTAHYDDVAASVVGELGEQIVGFDVNGDAGATASAAQVRAAVSGARAGSIVLLHMNQPHGSTAAGLAAALPALCARGITFTTLNSVT